MVAPAGLASFAVGDIRLTLLPDGVRALLDTGFGARTVVLADLGLEFWGGRLLTSLAAVALTPADIDLVCYSHLHLDHVGWTATADAELIFPNARHVLAREEWEHWAGQPDGGGPGERDIGALTPHAELLDGETTVVPGLRIVPTFGHTPGHCSFLVESGTERAVVLVAVRAQPQIVVDEAPPGEVFLPPLA